MESAHGYLSASFEVERIGRDVAQLCVPDNPAYTLDRCELPEDLCKGEEKCIRGCGMKLQGEYRLRRMHRGKQCRVVLSFTRWRVEPPRALSGQPELHAEATPCMSRHVSQ
jgi:hypothetical protein